MSNIKLVITGVSGMCSLGNDYNTLKTNLATMIPETTAVKSFEFHELDREIPCYRISDFDPKAILGKKGLRTKDLSTKVLLATFETAFKNFLENESVENRAGIVVGTAFGSLQSIGDFLSDSIVNNVNLVNPMLFANTVINSPIGNANIRYGVKTLSTTMATGFNASMDAIIYTSDYLRRGYHTSIITGGIEEISYYTLLGLELSGALSKGNRIKPFSTECDGFVTGEGAALLLIQTEEEAKKQGRTIIAEIAGYSNAYDPNNSTIGYNPEGEGARYTIEQALLMAGIDAKDIDFIASDANGSKDGDSMEASIISSVFKDTPVTAYKSKIGECYGASTALSTACAIADLKDNSITGIGSSYEVMGGVNLISETITDRKSNYALVTSFSSDGNCGSLILKNVE